jgi:hypothetical protein
MENLMITRLLKKTFICFYSFKTDLYADTKFVTIFELNENGIICRKFQYKFNLIRNIDNYSNLIILYFTGR